MSSVQVSRGELVRGRGRAFALIWGAFGLFFGAVALAALGYGALHPSDLPVCLLNVALLAGPVYLMLRAAPRCWRGGVVVGERETVIVNPLRTYTVMTDDVARFETGGQEYGFGNPTAGIVLVKRDGGRIPVWALAREGLVWNVKRNSARWQDVAAQLNGLLPQYENSVAADGGPPTRPAAPNFAPAG